ncbi:MAG: DUF1501 domain-containing protein [Verrucomicrobia bacterium]|nr:DUF1501 domain-containing protein [Verrucomicrobiota bacterium]
MSNRAQSAGFQARSYARCRAFVAGALLLGDLCSAVAAPAPDYTRDVKPILEKRCASCHGRLKQKAHLRLDASALIHKGGKNGPIIVTGKSGDSPLIRRVSSTDESERMPADGQPLSAEQISLLAAWIDAGAPYPEDENVPASPAEHWAFQTVRRPAVPPVKNGAWCRNPIDRFVQLYSGGGHIEDTWDGHNDCVTNHKLHAGETDKPIAALMADLKRTGLWEETLLVWGGEFGRTPTSEGLGKPGRDHDWHGFSMWLAGAGVKGGQAIGATDEFGFKATEDPVHVSDLHATMLHLMGLDHRKLTFFHSGLDQRLTGVVERNVVTKALA